MDLVYFILCGYGLTQILVYGSIFDSIRPSKEWLSGFGKLFHCTMCMGFWVGIFLWAINDFTELFSYEYSISNAFLLGCLGSGASYVLSMIFGDEGINLINRSNDNV